MGRHVKNVEKVYEILVECRKVFASLNGNSIVALKKMEVLCTKIDDIIGENNE